MILKGNIFVLKLYWMQISFISKFNIALCCARCFILTVIQIYGLFSGHYPIPYRLFNLYIVCLFCQFREINLCPCKIIVCYAFNLTILFYLLMSCR